MIHDFGILGKTKSRLEGEKQGKAAKYAILLRYIATCVGQYCWFVVSIWGFMMRSKKRNAQ